MRDLGLLILRLAFGGLLSAHGAQKLFGAFEGHGLEGTGKFFEKIGFQPGKQWAFMAGLGESGGIVYGIGRGCIAIALAQQAPFGKRREQIGERGIM